jgi:nucleoid-associated protein YgaU
MASITGFDDLWTDGDLMTPEVLVEAFKRVLRGCNQIEVSWAGEIRRGVMAEFIPEYETVEDIAWSVIWDWSQIGDTEAPRASAAEDTQSQIDSAMEKLNNAVADIPPIILPNVTGPIVFAEQAVEQGLLGLSASSGAIFGIPTVTNEQFQDVATFAEQAAAAARELFELTMDSSIEDFLATDTVADMLAAETWRRAMGQAAQEAEQAAVDTRESIRQRVVDDYLAIVTVREGETLRTLARDWYGDADAWTTIADANSLTSAIVPIGTIIFIPRQSTPGSGSSL